MSNRRDDEYIAPDLMRFLDELDAIDWFAHVGQPVDDVNVRRVTSWSDAWDCLSDESWTGMSVHAHVNSRHPAWVLGYDRGLKAAEQSGRNHVFDEGTTAAAAAAYDDAAATYEIAVASENRFFVRLMEWYRRGHWPCGWDGTYPEGHLIVY